MSPVKAQATVKSEGAGPATRRGSGIGPVPSTGGAVWSSMEVARGSRCACGGGCSSCASGPGVDVSHSVDPLPIQRKCACGGSCPTCELEEEMIQTKLRIGSPNDKYEREADRVADQVMRVSEHKVPRLFESQDGTEEIVQTKPQITPLVQRQTEDREDDSLQANEIRGSTSGGMRDMHARVTTMQGGGQALSGSERAFFEPRFGHDFGSVRIHTNDSAARAVDDANARAFTVGRDIAFGAAQYSPESRAGGLLMAHELTHVVQQWSGPDLIQREVRLFHSHAWPNEENRHLGAEQRWWQSETETDANSDRLPGPNDDVCRRINVRVNMHRLIGVLEGLAPRVELVDRSLSCFQLFICHVYLQALAMTDAYARELQVSRELILSSGGAESLSDEEATATADKIRDVAEVMAEMSQMEAILANSLDKLERISRGAITSLFDNWKPDLDLAVLINSLESSSKESQTDAFTANLDLSVPIDLADTQKRESTEYAAELDLTVPIDLARIQAKEIAEYAGDVGDLEGLESAALRAQIIEIALKFGRYRLHQLSALRPSLSILYTYYPFFAAMSPGEVSGAEDKDLLAQVDLAYADMLQQVAVARRRIETGSIDPMMLNDAVGMVEPAMPAVAECAMEHQIVRDITDMLALGIIGTINPGMGLAVGLVDTAFETRNLWIRREIASVPTNPQDGSFLGVQAPSLLEWGLLIAGAALDGTEFIDISKKLKHLGAVPNRGTAGGAVKTPPSAAARGSQAATSTPRAAPRTGKAGPPPPVSAAEKSRAAGQPTAQARQTRKPTGPRRVPPKEKLQTRRKEVLARAEAQGLDQSEEYKKIRKSRPGATKKAETRNRLSDMYDDLEQRIDSEAPKRLVREKAELLQQAKDLGLSDLEGFQRLKDSRPSTLKTHKGIVERELWHKGLQRELGFDPNLRARNEAKVSPTHNMSRGHMEAAGLESEHLLPKSVIQRDPEAIASGLTWSTSPTIMIDRQLHAAGMTHSKGIGVLGGYKSPSEMVDAIIDDYTDLLDQARFAHLDKEKYIQGFDEIRAFYKDQFEDVFKPSRVDTFDY